MIRTLPAPAATLLIAGLSFAQPQPAEEPPVTVEGTNHNGILFTWDVTNHTHQAINYFEIPVYGINTFEAPEGWEIVRRPRHKQGNFILKTDKYTAMIRPNRTLTFECKRPSQDIPLDGRVTAAIGLEDGTRIQVPNVLAPIKRTVLENLLLPISLGVLLVIFAVVQAFRGRKRPGPSVSSSTQPETVAPMSDTDKAAPD